MTFPSPYADFETQVLEITNKRQYAPEDIDHITDFLLDIILTGCGLEKTERRSTE